MPKTTAILLLQNRVLTAIQQRSVQSSCAAPVPIGLWANWCLSDHRRVFPVAGMEW